VYTREAGSGDVSVSIEGPSKAKIEMVDRQCGYVTVGYVVSKPGDELASFVGRNLSLLPAVTVRTEKYWRCLHICVSSLAYLTVQVLV